jgi:hypothetical protein
MSNKCETVLDTHDLVIDLIGSSVEGGIDLLEFSAKVVAQSFRNPKFRQSLTKSLEGQLRLRLQNNPVVTLNEEFKSPEIVQSLFLDPSKVALEEHVKQTINESHTFYNFNSQLRDKLSKFKCSKSGIYISKNKKKLIIRFSILAIGGGIALVVLRKSKQVQYLAQKAEGKTFKKTIGKLHVEGKFLEVNTGTDKYKIEFKKASIKSKLGKGELEGGVAFNALYDGKKMTLTPGNAEISYKVNDFIISAFSNKKINEIEKVSTSFKSNKFNKISTTVTLNKEKSLVVSNQNNYYDKMTIGNSVKVTGNGIEEIKASFGYDTPRRSGDFRITNGKIGASHDLSKELFKITGEINILFKLDGDRYNMSVKGAVDGEKKVFSLGIHRSF